MAKEPRRVKLAASTDLLALVEEVKTDKAPRVLERNGVVLAAIVSVEDLEKIVLPFPSPEGIRRALEAAGAWKDVDTDALIEDIYRWRHESPPRPPVRL